MDYGALTAARLRSGQWLHWGIRFFLAAALTASETVDGYAPFALGCIAAAGPGAGGGPPRGFIVGAPARGPPPAPGAPRFAVWRNCRQRVPDPAATFLIVSGKIGEADGFRPGRGIRLHGGRPEIGNGVFVPGQRFPRSASLSFSGFSSSSQSNQGNSRRPPSEKRV